MTTTARSAAEQRLVHALTAYTHEMAFSDEDPGAILDRYFAPGFVYVNDGLPLDRAKLFAHATPVRKNAVSAHIDMHDVLIVGDRAAARYTLHATMRKGRTVVNEVYMFAHLAPDGRLLRIDQTTRPVDHV